MALWCKRSCRLIISTIDRAVIVLCIRWDITYKLSYRDLVEMTAERGVGVSHTTMLRRVQRYVPEFEKRWHRHTRPVGLSWRVDETYKGHCRRLPRDARCYQRIEC